MQRVTSAAVTIVGKIRREIGPGLVILLGVSPDDTDSDVDYLADKIAGLRIFTDSNGKMNVSVQEVAGAGCLVISQFTLYGDCRRGRRPSFTDAAPPDIAIPLYERFVDMMRHRHGLPVATGEFGAHMLVEINNDGPVTLLLESRKAF